MKTLKFERAGMKLNDMNDVGTGRIRTAFHTKDGEGLYLELMAVRSNKNTCSWAQWERTGFIDSCYEIEGDEITSDYISHPIDENHRHFEWTLAEILNLVNYIGGDFDEVIVCAPESYRVFKSTSTNECNFCD